MSRYREEEEWLYQLVFALRSSKQKDDKSPFKRHLGQNKHFDLSTREGVYISKDVYFSEEKMCTLVRN